MNFENRDTPEPAKDDEASMAEEKIAAPPAAPSSPFAAPAGGQPAETVRTGSPFAAVPERAIPVYASEREGVFKETARGGTVAAVMLALFGLAGLWIFPGGAVAVGALGIATACLGLASPWWHVGTAALLANAGICAAAFTQLM